MEISKKIRLQLRIQGFSFVILVLVITGLLIQVSLQYNVEFDWTATSRHTLNEVSAKIVEKIDAPLKITSYATNDPLSEVRQDIRELIKRYQKMSDQIEIKFIDPRLSPQITQDLGIRIDGEMVIEYQGRSEHLQDFTEKGVTNTIQRLLRNNDRHILFLTGHGERNPTGRANHDLGIFGEILSNKGFHIGPLSLGQDLSVPANTSVLVIASPQIDYLEGEIKIIKDYVAAGGNLLWLIEPNKSDFLSPLANYLNLNITKGTIIDPDIALLSNSPTLVLGQHLDHAITKKLLASQIQTFYPEVVGINIFASETWTVQPLIQSTARSWLEVGEIKGTIKLDLGLDIDGPINFAQSLTRTIADKSNESGKERTQRIVVIGDGDFISNTHLGMQGNMAMGESIFNWLAHDDNFIDIPSVIAPDSKIATDPVPLIAIVLLIFIILPILLIGCGMIIWLKRRKK